jgi:putative hydrolase of the HAD superfamily
MLVHELLRAWKHCLLFVGGFMKKQYLLKINTLPSNHLFKRSFFDIRCVLLSNGWRHAPWQATAAKFAVDYGEMNYLHEFIFNVYELGSITLLDYLDRVLFYSLRSFTREAFKEFIFAQSIELPHTLPWLIRWNHQNWDRFRIISINNEGRELNGYRIGKFRLHDLFDAICFFLRNRHDNA